jgi:hypothetical protein
MRSRDAAALIVAVLGLGSWGCATAPTAPDGWLSRPEDLPRDPRGGWIEVECTNTESVRHRLDGELLAIDDDRLYVAVGGGMESVALDSVATARLTAYAAQTGSMGNAVVGGVLLTASNGVLLIFTAPMWVIGGSAAAATRSREPIVQFPQHAWNEVRPYARFPQGLPAGFVPGTAPRVPPAAPPVETKLRVAPALAPRTASEKAFWFDAAVGLGFHTDHTGVGGVVGVNAAYRALAVGARISWVHRDDTVLSPADVYDESVLRQGGYGSGETFDLALLVGLRGMYRGLHASVSGGPAGYAFEFNDILDFDGSWGAQAACFVFPWPAFGIGSVVTYNWNDFRDFYVISFGIAVGAP